jgi:hypothetical protein
MKQQDILEGFQECLEQGQQKGREQGELQELRSTFVHLITTRFPDLELLAGERAEKEEEPEPLRILLEKLFPATTSQEIRDLLTAQ